MIFENKKRIYASIAVLFMLLMVLPIALLPLTNAASRYFYSYVYVADSAGPRGVGVGEQMLIVAWTADMPPDTGEISGVVSSPNGRAGWYGMQIQVWDPDNETEIINMPYSDPVGANYISYTPTKVGNYTIQAIFPRTDKELKVNLVSGGSTFIAGDHYIYSEAVSPKDTFEVYDKATQPWIESPLPNGYWTRPISGASREWYTLAGSWLGGAANVWPMGSSGGNIGTYAWGAAPESAHILWSKPFFLGGVTDERFERSAGHTAHYQGVEFSPTIILDGKIHWSPRYTTHGNKGYEIIDLYTGETLFLDWNATRPAFGSIYEYESPNQHGTFSYLWDTGRTVSFFGSSGTPIQLPPTVTLSNVTQRADLSVVKVGTPYKAASSTVNTGTIWRMMDAHTGNTICYIANVSTAGTNVYGKDGSILYYNIVGTPIPGSRPTQYTAPYRLTVWNSSAGTMVASQSGTGYWQWRPAGGDFGAENPYFGTGDFNNPMTMDWDIVHDGRVFYSQNFTIPNIEGPKNSISNETGSIRCIREGDIMIVGTQGINDKRGQVQGVMVGISLKPENKGTELWRTTFTPPYVDMDKNITMAAMFTGGFTLNAVYPEDNVMVFSEVKQLKAWVYDLTTGQELWHTEPGELPQYNFYGQSVQAIDGQLLIYGGYAGEINSFDIRTGDKLWTYDAMGVGEESPYGNYPMQIGAISDDKIYTVSWEHSYTIPIIRGPNLRCINATTGEEIWSILDFGTGMAIADGRLVCSNSVDNMIYCYGKGRSATTVSAPQSVTALGGGIMLTGTVTDDTPTGRRTTNDEIDFLLQGTPAISDKDMSRWMEYLFMQQVYPADAEGVPVSLYAIDPNGNYITIGDATSDINGNYGILFTPDVPGTYQIHATFEGSKSYGSSTATTYLAVGEAPANTPAATEPPTQSIADQYFVPAIVGLFVFIAIIGAVIILIVRKRP